MLPGVPWGVGGLGAEKYRQHVPTPDSTFEGAPCKDTATVREPRISKVVVAPVFRYGAAVLLPC